jgi:hypothetical protein
LDPAASDDVGAKVSAAVADAEAKLRHRLVNAGFAQYGAGPGPGGHAPRDGSSSSGGSSGSSGGSGQPAELNGDEFSTTGYIGPDFAEMRRHLTQVLDAPKQLSIDVQPDLARIGVDNGPTLDYPFGDTFTRIDEYGTARIDSNWSGATLVVRARYSSHATLAEHYAGDSRTGTLTMMRELTDPAVGKLTVHAIYRRQAAADDRP